MHQEESTEKSTLTEVAAELLLKIRFIRFKPSAEL